MKTFLIDNVPYTVQDEVDRLIAKLKQTIEIKDLTISQNQNEIKQYRGAYRNFFNENECSAKTINYRLDQIKKLIISLNIDLEFCIEKNFFKDEDEKDKDQDN